MFDFVYGIYLQELYMALDTFSKLYLIQFHRTPGYIMSTVSILVVENFLILLILVSLSDYYLINIFNLFIIFYQFLYLNS